MSSFSQYWPAALFLLQGLMAWALWSMRRAFASRDDLERLRAERSQSGDRIWRHITEQQQIMAVLQERLASIPDHREMVGLREQVGEVQGDVKAIGTGLAGLREMQAAQTATLTRVQDYLLRPGS